MNIENTENLIILILAVWKKRNVGNIIENARYTPSKTKIFTLNIKFGVNFVIKTVVDNQIKTTNICGHLISNDNRCIFLIGFHCYLNYLYSQISIS